MNIQNIKASFQQTAYNLGNKIKSVPATNKEQYIIDRLYAANEKIRDTFSGDKATKIFNKVENKAAKDWASMHKIQSFVLKNSDKLAKGAIVGGIVAASVAVLSLGAKAISSLVNKD